MTNTSIRSSAKLVSYGCRVATVIMLDVGTTNLASFCCVGCRENTGIENDAESTKPGSNKTPEFVTYAKIGLTNLGMDLLA